MISKIETQEIQFHAFMLTMNFVDYLKITKKETLIEFSNDANTNIFSIFQLMDSAMFCIISGTKEMRFHNKEKNFLWL